MEVGEPSPATLQGGGDKTVSSPAGYAGLISHNPPGCPDRSWRTAEPPPLRPLKLQHALTQRLIRPVGDPGAIRGRQKDRAASRHGREPNLGGFFGH